MWRFLVRPLQQSAHYSILTLLGEEARKTLVSEPENAERIGSPQAIFCRLLCNF
jgi:hypothetical protein